MIAARQIAFGKAAGVKKPYDAEIEYLESTGTQYIDTGVRGGSNSGVEIVAYSINTTLNAGLFGARDADYKNSFSVWQRVSNEQVRFDYTGTGSNNYVQIKEVWKVGQVNVLKKDGVKNFVNGVEYAANRANEFVCGYPFYLFSINTAGVSIPWFIGYVKSCRIYDNDTIICDLIPVRVGSVGYMYDKVSGTLFGNSGTGEFVLGPDVLDYTSWVEGEYWNTFGEAVALDGASRCENLIPVQPSTSVTFFFGERPNGVSLYLIQYDSTGKRIDSNYNANGMTRTITLNAYCYYIRISCATKQKSEVYVFDNTNNKYIVQNGEVVELGK